MTINESDSHDGPLFFSVQHRFCETVLDFTHLHHETAEIFPQDAQSSLNFTVKVSDFNILLLSLS